MAATRAPTPASTGRTTRSPPGRRATRSRRTARDCGAGIGEAELDAIDERARAAVAAAEAEARAAPEPSPDVLETQVWADGGSAWRN